MRQKKRWYRRCLHREAQLKEQYKQIKRAKGRGSREADMALRRYHAFQSYRHRHFADNPYWSWKSSFDRWPVTYQWDWRAWRSASFRQDWWIDEWGQLRAQPYYDDGF